MHSNATWVVALAAGSTATPAPNVGASLTPGSDVYWSCRPCRQAATSHHRPFPRVSRSLVVPNGGRVGGGPQHSDRQELAAMEPAAAAAPGPSLTLASQPCSREGEGGGDRSTSLLVVECGCLFPGPSEEPPPRRPSCRASFPDRPDGPCNGECPETPPPPAKAAAPGLRSPAVVVISRWNRGTCHTRLGPRADTRDDGVDGGGAGRDGGGMEGPI
ncbi:unnamed protein product [Merluccius merluccius]